MKRTLLTLLTTVTVTLGAGALHTAPALADTPLHVIIDGQELQADTPFLLVQGRAIAPAGALFSALGAQVTWQNDYSQVNAALSGNTVAMALGVADAWNNGTHRYLDVAPLVTNNRTMVPLRFASEALGARVDYNAATRTISVTTHPARPASAASLGNQIAAYARRFDGYRYGWGASGPDAFDCSGFTYYVLGQFGIQIPRIAFDQFAGGRAVDTGSLQPGDLVFFTTYQAGASHVGIYLGNDQFINAQSSRAGVKIQSLSNPFWAAHYIGARRFW